MFTRIIKTSADPRFHPIAIAVGKENNEERAFLIRSFLKPDEVFGPSHFGTKFVDHVYDGMSAAGKAKLEEFYNKAWNIFSNPIAEEPPAQLARRLLKLVEEEFPRRAIESGVESAIVEDVDDVVSNFSTDYFFTMAPARLLAPVWSHWAYATRSNQQEGAMLGWSMLTSADRWPNERAAPFMRQEVRSRADEILDLGVDRPEYSGVFRSALRHLTPIQYTSYLNQAQAIVIMIGLVEYDYHHHGANLYNYLTTHVSEAATRILYTRVVDEMPAIPYR